MSHRQNTPKFPKLPPKPLKEKPAGKLPSLREVHAAIEAVKVKEAVKQKLDPAKIKKAQDGA